MLQRFAAAFNRFNRTFAVAPRKSSSDRRRLGANTNRDRLFSLKCYQVEDENHVIALGE